MFDLANFFQSPFDVLEFIIVVVIGACVLVLFTAILINFIESRHRTGIKQEKRSIVATGTMTMFFLVFYFLIRSRVGVIEMENIFLRIILIVLGLVVMLLGCFVNVRGRLFLGCNWADQIKIYQDHTLIIKDIYAVVRHPLYASLIWMFYGASLVYLNYAAFLANTFVFVPFMYYRARQEEILLTKQFDYYKNYTKKVGMFFPKLFGGKKDV